MVNLAAFTRWMVNMPEELIPCPAADSRYAVCALKTAFFARAKRKSVKNL